MIEKILERLEEVRMRYFLTIANGGNEKLDFAYGYISETVDQCKEIVQEVAKEYNWIPVEVAMPTEEGWYRVTCDNKTYWKTPMVRDLYYYPRIKCFVDNIRRSEHPYEDIKKFDWTEDVTAWKPVDAPYQKGE